MGSYGRRSVLRKIAARRQRTQRWELPAVGASVLARAVPLAPSRGPLPVYRTQWLLTRRQLEVLRLVATGESDRRIADRLSVSPRTVNTHVSNILARLEVPSRYAAVITATRIGLL